MNEGIVMAPMRETLDELGKVAAALNRESDQLNELIADFEDELEKAGVGVSVWLDVVLDPTPTYDKTNESDHTWQEYRGWRLGYTKLDRWCVAVKQVRFERNHHDQNERPYQLVEGEDETEIDCANTLMMLVRASRVVRLQAVEHLEDLARALTRQMKLYVDSLAKAKQRMKD